MKLTNSKLFNNRLSNELQNNMNIFCLFHKINGKINYKTINKNLTRHTSSLSLISLFYHLRTQSPSLHPLFIYLSL